MASKIGQLLRSGPIDQLSSRVLSSFARPLSSFASPIRATLFPGDGIGPEIAESVKQVSSSLLINPLSSFQFDYISLSFQYRSILLHSFLSDFIFFVWFRVWEGSWIRKCICCLEKFVMGALGCAFPDRNRLECFDNDKKKKEWFFCPQVLSASSLADNDFASVRQCYSTSCDFWYLHETKHMEKYAKKITFLVSFANRLWVGVHPNTPFNWVIVYLEEIKCWAMLVLQFAG